MNIRRRLRPLAYWLADLMEEQWAPALRKAVERKPRPRPLRFPTDFELVMEHHVAQMARKLLEDTTFLLGKDWPIRVMPYDEDPKRVPINKITGRVLKPMTPADPDDWRVN